MFIHTYREAHDAVVEILDLPGRRAQIVACTVKIMQCLEAETRDFMAQCQSLLLEGGLGELQRRRAVIDAPSTPNSPNSSARA